MTVSIPPVVAAIIIHWNQEGLTRETIQSLLLTGYSQLSIILVDNGSTDGSGVRIAADYPDLLLVRSAENLGYAGGANLGFLASLNMDAPYHFLLNNDVVFDSTIVDVLVNVMEDDCSTQVGICVPKIYFFDDPQRIWYAGGDIDTQTGLCSHFGYGQIDGQEYAAKRDCSFANGCAMFIRREVLEHVGFFDTSYFHTGEDVDLSINLLEKGYRVLFVPSARLWHKIRASAGGRRKTSFLYLYYEYRNHVLIMRKYFYDKQCCKSYLRLAKFYCRGVMRELASGNAAGAGGIIRGLIDGYRGVHGKRI